jgi:hypothetical protein
MESAPYTRVQYVRAFVELGPRVSEAQRRMLMAHANAPGTVLDVVELARAAGQVNPQFTYSQYGRLGRALFDAIGDTEGWGIWTRVLADDRRDSRTKLVCWTLYPEVAAAVRQMGWTVSSVSASSLRDIRSAEQELRGVSKTTRQALIDARVGQGLFRQALIEEMGGCAVTGCQRLEALRASHIKPWRDSSNAERLDPNNGLLLLGTLDALFDAGLITFAADGRLNCSKELTKSERQQLGLSRSVRLHDLRAAQAKFLQWHRTKVFRG